MGFKVENASYRFEDLDGDVELHTGNEVRTLFMHSGNAALFIDDKWQVLGPNQGIIIGPDLGYKLKKLDNDFYALQTSSNLTNRDEIILIEDHEGEQTESALEGYKMIPSQKKVEKPWGHELWVSWFKNHHVLKQIYMNQGLRSSFQVHREKLETNFLVQGEAKVVNIEQHPYNFDADPEEERQRFLDMDQNDHSSHIRKGGYWTSSPGIVHRVVSISAYTAYEVSTPQLDDIVRIKDDTGRGDGRIDSEHDKK